MQQWIPKIARKLGFQVFFLVQLENSKLTFQRWLFFLNSSHLIFSFIINAT